MKQLKIEGTKKPDKSLLCLLLSDGFDSDEIAEAFPISEKQIYEALKQWEFEPKEFKKLLSDVRKALRLTDGKYTGFYCSPDDPITKAELDYNRATTRGESVMKMWYYDRFICEKVQSSDHKRAVLNCKINKKLDAIGLYLLHYYIESIRKQMSTKNKLVLNSSGETCEDILHDLFLECYDTGEIRPFNALVFQLFRKMRK